MFGRTVKSTVTFKEPSVEIAGDPDVVLALFRHVLEQRLDAKLPVTFAKESADVRALAEKIVMERGIQTT